MDRPDVDLAEELGDPHSFDILLELLAADQGLTQRELAAALKLDSGGTSRRMKRLEQLGLVERERSHGPYELTFPDETRDTLERVTNLAAAGLARRAEGAKRRADAFRKAGMRGDRLRARTRKPAP